MDGQWETKRAVMAVSPKPGFLDVIKHHRMFSRRHRTLGKEEMEGRPDTTERALDPTPESLSTSAGHE